MKKEREREGGRVKREMEELEKGLKVCGERGMERQTEREREGGRVRRELEELEKGLKVCAGKRWRERERERERERGKK